MDLYWIWLSELKGVGPVRQKRLLQVFKHPENVYRASPGELITVPGLGPETVKSITQARSLDRAERIVEDLAKLNINILRYDQASYLQAVKDTAEAPVVLYYRGHLPESGLGVGIVGARRCTAYGKQVTIEAATFLAQQGIPIVSGMAKGIDGYAHTACLQAGGYTMAILGNGVDTCYPQEHQSLMEQIIHTGAVLSPYPPRTPARPRHFPRRNSLISAWSYKLLVVEAGEKSGALITAQSALKQNKAVMAVPNGIFCPESKGCNRLIAQGALIYLEPTQLLLDTILATKRKTSQEILPPTPKIDYNNNQNSTVVKPQSPLEQAILSYLSSTSTPVTIEHLASVLQIDQWGLIEALSVLELEKKIKNSKGTWYHSRYIEK